MLLDDGLLIVKCYKCTDSFHGLNSQRLGLVGLQSREQHAFDHVQVFGLTVAENPGDRSVGNIDWFSTSKNRQDTGFECTDLEGLSARVKPRMKSYTRLYKERDS